MSRAHACCLNCGRHKVLTHMFCHDCTIVVDSGQKIAMRRVAELERPLTLNVRKLLANADHLRRKSAELHECGRLLRMLGVETGQGAKVIQAKGLDLRSLGGEAHVLIGRIARQRGAIDAYRRQHGIARDWRVPPDDGGRISGARA
jgi:predicted acylesterase/phospholipase RssA